MAKFSIITIGAAGVDMRQNPLFLENSKASHATNLTFDEATIKTRFDIEYQSLGLRGQFQGSTYFSPSTGLSATSYSNAPSSLATVVNGVVSLNVIQSQGISSTPIVLQGGENFKGDTYLFDAENYLIVLNPQSASYWSDAGGDLVRSPGLTESGGESHDKLDSSENKNWLPNGASIGHYIHAQNHISVDFGNNPDCPALNSEIWVSDIGGSRTLDDCSAEDILKMEAAMLDSGGGTLVAPSRLGKSVAFETLLSSGNNGEGFFVDFRECGIVFHNTFEMPRETMYGENDSMIQEGWDEKRITNVQLQTVSTVGRYGPYQLPDDIWFRSEYGYHFLKKTLGTGTLKDEKRNHESHDIQPLIDMDEDQNLEGLSSGYWLKNDRLMGTVGVVQNSLFSSTSMGRGIVVLNQATTYTEDDTPRALWEGLWLPDKGVNGIHKFTKLGPRAKNKEFGFICSDNNRNIFVAEFKNRRSGYDRRDNKDYLIPWQYTSGSFVMNGLKTIDKLRSAVLDFVGDESTSEIEVQVRTDQHQCWETWGIIKPCLNSKSVTSKALGEPSAKSIREATWFQFRIKGQGYIEIRTFDVEATKVDSKKDGRNACVPVCCEQENYF